MNRNKKLEHLITGKSIVSVNDQPDGNVVVLDDGSHVSVKGRVAGAPTGTAVSEVWQEGKVLRLGFVDGTTNDITLAEETSSVLVRDAKGGFAYSD